MKAIPDAWDFIMALHEKNILKSLEFDGKDIGSISLSYENKQD